MQEPAENKPEFSSRASDTAPEQEDMLAHVLPRSQAIISLSDFLAQAALPPGRYTSPRGMVEKLMLEYQKHLAELGGAVAPGSFVFAHPHYPVPPQWQAILDYLFGEGLITSRYVVFEKLFHDEPKIFSLRLFSVFGKDPTDGRTPTAAGHSRGVSLDFEEALSKVIGEFLERYPLMQYKREDLVRASVKDLVRSKERFLDVNDLAGFAVWQKELFPGRRFDGSSNFFWVEGIELLSGEKSLIPAQLVFWNYNTMQEPGEPYLRQPITNGAAGHFTRTEAILAGIYESIQRDAFLVHWLNSIAPPRIDNASIEDAEIQKLIANFSRYGIEVVFLDTTLDFEVPSCVCVLIDTTGRGPKISLGGGCGPSLEQGLMRSITEALGVYHWLRLQPEESVVLPDGYRPFRDTSIGHEKRLQLWSDGAMFPLFAPFLSGRVVPCRVRSYPKSFLSPKAELDRILEISRKKGKGYEVYVYEAQHRILKTLGYSSVKVVIPALIPLYLNEQDAPLAASRLRSVILDTGREPKAEYNPWPHPFP